MKLDSTKKLRNMGSSLGVVIPSNLLKDMNLTKEDSVVLYYDEQKKELVIKKNV